MVFSGMECALELNTVSHTQALRKWSKGTPLS